MKEVEVEVWEEDYIGYVLTDYDGRKYGVIDHLNEKGLIEETQVIDYETSDEIEDSELWKRIINARAANAVTLQELQAEES